MPSVCVLYAKIVLTFAFIAGFEKAFATGQRDTNETEESEHLAGFLFEQFRRGLATGGGLQSKRIENNGLLVIRGIKFRTVLEGLLLMLIIFLIL